MSKPPTFRRGSISRNDQPLPIEVPQAPAQKPASSDRPNRYGSKCRKCGVWVEAGEGNLVGSAGAGWGAEHIECPTMLPQPGDEEMTSPWQPEVSPAHVVNTVKGQPLYDGIYTYETATAHRTFRLKTQPLEAEFMPGKQLLQVLGGPDNEHDYQSMGHILPIGPGNQAYLKVWKKWQDRTNIVTDAKAFLADPHGPNVLASVNCFRCGRTLTVPASVHNGLGPECAKKGL